MTITRLRDYDDKKTPTTFPDEMPGRIFLVANRYEAGSYEAQNMMQVAKHGSFIFFPELGFAKVQSLIFYHRELR